MESPSELCLPKPTNDRPATIVSEDNLNLTLEKNADQKLIRYQT